MIFPDLLKDPVDIVDHQLDWTGQVGTGVTIATSEWEVESTDVTLSAEAVEGLVTSVRISGGLEDRAYRVENTVEFSDGSKLRRGFRVLVRRNL